MLRCGEMIAFSALVTGTIDELGKLPQRVSGGKRQIIHGGTTRLKPMAEPYKHTNAICAPSRTMLAPEPKRRRIDLLLNHDPPPTSRSILREPPTALAALSDVCSSAAPMSSAPPPPTPMEIKTTSSPHCKCIDELRSKSQATFHAISTSSPDIALTHIAHLRTALQNIQSCRVFSASQAASADPTTSLNAVLALLGVVASALNATCLGLIPQLASTQHLSPTPPLPHSTGCAITASGSTNRLPTPPPQFRSQYTRDTLEMGAYRPPRQLQNLLWGTALMHELEGLLGVVRRFDLGATHREEGVPADPAYAQRLRAGVQISGLFDETMSQLTLWVNVPRS